MPTFSVIIPVYNRWPLLEATLASVWKQAFTDYEIIVVDDGSTDDTPLYLSELRDHVTVITQANAGPGVARNNGAAHAQGTYLAFLDADDLWFPWTLQTVAELIVKRARPALIAASLLPFRNTAEVSSISHTEIAAEFYRDYLSASDRDCFVGAGMTFVRRDKFLEVGGFCTQPINLEDHDLILRLGTAAGFVRILEPPTLAYRSDDNSWTTQSERSFAGCRYVIENEQLGVYPGGKLRRLDRRKVITRHIRPWALTFKRTGEWQPAWSLYKSTFVWNLSLHRWRFLMGFWSNFS